MATVTDNFNRANGTLGANWTTCPGHSALVIATSTVQASSASVFCAALWSATSFASNQYSQVRISTAATSGSEAVGIIVRAKAGVDEFYLGFVTNASWLLYHRTGGAYNLLQTAAIASAAGDIAKLEVIGNTISFYKNGTLVNTPFVATGGQIITGGSPGILIFDTGHGISVDDWESVDTSTVTVTVNLTGVGASPAIGAGTVTIGSAAVTPPDQGLVAGGGHWFGLPEKEKVYLTGVAANPQVGSIVPSNLGEMYRFPVAREVQMPEGLRSVLRKPSPKPPLFVYPVRVPGARAAVGKMTTKEYYEDIDEELIAILSVL